MTTSIEHVLEYPVAEDETPRCTEDCPACLAALPKPDPYADSPDAGNTQACNCGGAWHAMQQHCIDWPCPGCDRLCPPEPGTQDGPAR